MYGFVGLTGPCTSGGLAAKERTSEPGRPVLFQRPRPGDGPRSRRIWAQTFVATAHGFGASTTFYVTRVRGQPVSDELRCARLYFWARR